MCSGRQAPSANVQDHRGQGGRIERAFCVGVAWPARFLARRHADGVADRATVAFGARGEWNGRRRPRRAQAALGLALQWLKSACGAWDTRRAPDVWLHAARGARHALERAD
eukprot:scaffold286661_cov26-Tisochrysis_lutea.AAC.4